MNDMQARNQALLDAQMRQSAADRQMMIDTLLAQNAQPAGGGGGGGRSTVRVKADIEWPSFDAKDVYYDIEDFFRDFNRVAMLSNGGGRV